METCTKHMCSKSTLQIEEADTSKPKPIIKSHDTMYIVDSGASFYMMGESSLSPQERKTKKTTLRSKQRMASSVPQKRRRFASRSSVLTCTCSWWQIRLRYGLLDDCAINWSAPSVGNPGGNPTPTTCMKTITCCVSTISFLSSRRREGPLRWRQHASAIVTKRANDSTPNGDHNVFTHFPKHQNCEVCKMPNTTRASCKTQPSETRRWNPTCIFFRTIHCFRPQDLGSR